MSAPALFSRQNGEVAASRPVPNHPENGETPAARGSEERHDQHPGGWLVPAGARRATDGRREVTAVEQLALEVEVEAVVTEDPLGDLDVSRHERFVAEELAKDRSRGVPVRRCGCDRPLREPEDRGLEPRCLKCGRPL
jgi:hypothetical protein